ncbi:unnamed protein product [Vitrella brassicaformis CCMP3155]|uniref:Uncharacterized protein n=1 Tax=Vitrella brassicaformis (strain CCMP3155) TaxID=1169540 RepID=A0A0G4EC35_VITBC|nr:unnamed protein product [Vitrella brassicaformis CCMP3155]|eukprot:CEL93246.1 unnamed protein product [Vitrella brassicaformis CCMP3155]
MVEASSSQRPHTSAPCPPFVSRYSSVGRPLGGTNVALYEGRMPWTKQHAYRTSYRATLDSDKFREFHKRTKLDSGEKVLSHDLPAGYQHYTTPLGHTWRYAPPIIPAARKSNYESILPKYQKGARGGGGGLETGSLF